MEKFSEKLKKLFSSESSLQRIPLYFFFTCVLLVVLICKLGETNHYLKEIAENGTEVIKIQTKDNNDDVDIYIDTTKSAEDYIPLLEEMTDDSTTTEKEKETTTKKDETTSTTKESVTQQSSTQKNENKSDKTTYVLNISSKKIHLPECSFVDRTKEENKRVVELTEEELKEYLNNGYTFCKTCGGN